MQRLLTVVFVVLVTTPAIANPTHVKSMIQKGGAVVVSCAPMTCTDEEEARLKVLAAQLHAATQGRVIVIRAPIGYQAEPYAALGDQVGLGKSDVVLARGETGWAIRAPGLPAEMVRALEQQLGTDSVEVGLGGLVKELPRALTAHASDAAVTPNLVPAGGGGRSSPSGHSSAPAETPSRSDDGEVPLWPLGVGLGVVAIAAIWLLRRNSATR